VSRDKSCRQEVVVCVVTSLGYTQGRGSVLCVKGVAHMARFGGIINDDLEQIKENSVISYLLLGATSNIGTWL